MPKIIKKAGVEGSPVVVKEERTRGFRSTRFAGGGAADLPQGSGEHAEGLVDPAKAADAEAARILSDAEDRAAAMMREAMTRGYADGMAEGLRVAEEQRRGYLERLATLARQAIIDRDSMIRSTEQEMATLALEIASKVIRREISGDPTVVLAIVEAALEKIGTTEGARIMVHPEDADLLRQRWYELKGAVALGSNWEILGDDRMERGGCIIETKSGLVDSRIETQLAQIIAAFEEGQ